jgi:hypothetical protein
VALPDVDFADLPDPDYFATLRDKATQVTLDEGEHATVTLTLAEP